jgi:hypothetical protein
MDSEEEFNKWMAEKKDDKKFLVQEAWDTAWNRAWNACKVECVETYEWNKTCPICGTYRPTCQPPFAGLTIS